MSILEVLSERELDIAEHITLGYSEKETADRLCISPKTVHTHTYNIRKKLNARCAVDIARKFILSLENPKQYFAAIALTLVQILIITNSYSVEVRRLPKTARITRIYRKAS